MSSIYPSPHPKHCFFEEPSIRATRLTLLIREYKPRLEPDRRLKRCFYSRSDFIEKVSNEPVINHFRTAVPLRGQATQIPSNLSPKRDCGPKRVKTITLSRRVIKLVRAKNCTFINKNMLRYVPGQNCTYKQKYAT